jgi:predicted TIM-barrel fold metal-dependent hydrolase
MAIVSDVIDIVLPVTPVGVVKDPMELPPGLRTPSILNPVTPQDVLDRMDKYGISQSLIPARKYGQEWSVPYEALRDFVAEAPTRLFATAGLCPLNKMEGVRRFDEAVRDWGFVGAHAYTSWSGVPVADRLWYPYYAKAEELGVSIQIEVMGGKTRTSHGRPDQIDQVANDFPDLKIVAMHTGYPWERDLIGMAEFRSNVYVGYDTVMPHMWAEDLLKYAKDETLSGYVLRRHSGMPGIMMGSDRIVFGTNYLSMDIDRIFPTNARRLYNLPTPE